MNFSGPPFTPIRRHWSLLLLVVVGLLVAIGAIDGVARASGPPGLPGQPETPDTVVVGTATIPGVTGGNPDGSFNIVAYSLGLSVDSTSTAPTPTFSPVRLTKTVDSTDPTLFQLAATQAALPQVTVTIASSPGQPGIVYTLTHAEITGDQLSDSGAQGAPDLDQLTISYESIKVATS